MIGAFLFTKSLRSPALGFLCFYDFLFLFKQGKTKSYMAVPPPPFMKARKRFGQNFLVNDHIINSIVEAIDPREDELLVEIGPGHAALTRPVLDRAKALTAIELDRDLAERLRHDPFLKGLTLIEADALRADFYSIHPGKKIRVFGNLPYNITSPLLFHLFTFDNIIDMHFMLQKEVVERLAAGPGTKDYGRLTVMAQYYTKVVPVLTVPPNSFVPPPKVMSAVVRLKPKDLSQEDYQLAAYLNILTTHAFSARRKTIRNSLGNLLSPEELQENGISLDARAEDLALETYVKLARFIKDQYSLEDLSKISSEKAEKKRLKRLNKLNGNANEDESIESLNETSLETQQAATVSKVLDAKAAKMQDTETQSALNTDVKQQDETQTKKKKDRPRKPDRRKLHKTEFDYMDIDADL